ncbi:hypothetical protein EPO44_10280 [bacterium]|nr:MAG: hypothetical protein EPO44_10280 [bacterium]
MFTRFTSSRRAFIEFLGAALPTSAAASFAATTDNSGDVDGLIHVPTKLEISRALIPPSAEPLPAITAPWVLYHRFRYSAGEIWPARFHLFNANLHLECGLETTNMVMIGCLPAPHRMHVRSVSVQIPEWLDRAAANHLSQSAAQLIVGQRIQFEAPVSRMLSRVPLAAGIKGCNHLPCDAMLEAMQYFHLELDSHETFLTRADGWFCVCLEGPMLRPLQ